jgi:hypothetical protein
MIIKIFLAIVGLLILVYLLSRVQMKAWLHEIDDKLTKYLPKKDDSSQS